MAYLFSTKVEKNKNKVFLKTCKTFLLFMKTAQYYNIIFHKVKSCRKPLAGVWGKVLKIKVI